MRIELHSHTFYSYQTKVLYDGTCSPEEMVKAGSSLGLGAMAITDHDSFEGATKAMKFQKKYGIIVIPGEEVTTADGHCLAIGISEAVKSGLTIEETLDKIHQQSGIAISSHPFDIKKDGLGKKSKLCDAMEAFNALNVDRISNNRARNFAFDHGVPAVAGSDAHHTSMIGLGTIETNADSIDGIIQAIRKNRFEIITQYPSIKTIMNFAVLRLKLSYDYTNNYIEENYSFPKRQIAKKLLGTVNKSPGKIDYVFKCMAYAGFASVLTYSAARRVLHL
jgi:hypothetical protein